MAKFAGRMGWRTGAGAVFAGAVLWAGTALGWNQIGVPGTVLEGGDWSPGAQLLTKQSDGKTWTGTFAAKTDSGEFKFAANKAWTTAWGGKNASIVIERLPAIGIGPLTSSNGENMKLQAQKSGDALTFTFHDESDKSFDVTGAASAGTGLKAAQVVGEFNGNGSGSEAGKMAKSGDGTWVCEVELTAGTTVRLAVTDAQGMSGTWGPPMAWTVTASATEEAGWPMCGSATGTLKVSKGGRFRFVFDEATLRLTVLQTAVAVGTLGVPGTLLEGDDWTPGAQLLTKQGDGKTWTGTFSAKTDEGEFKFAADGAWDLSWGGADTDIVITRLPATGIGPLATEGNRNMKMQGQKAGDALTFTFHDEETATFDVAGAASAGTGLKAAQVVGDFNGHGSGSEVGKMSKSGSGAWECDVTLGSGTTVQLAVTDAKGQAGTWGPPMAWTVAVATNGTAAGWPMCGAAVGTLEIVRGGTFHFRFEESTLRLTVAQTSVTEFEAAGMSVDGNWQGSSGSGDGANLARSGKTYAGTFWITNASTQTLTFLFSERNENGMAGGQYYGYGTGEEAMSPVSLSSPFTGTAVAGTDRSKMQPFQLKSAAAGMYEVKFDKGSLKVEISRKYAKTSNVNLLEDPGFDQLDDNDFPQKWGAYNARCTTRDWHSGRSAGYLSRTAASDGMTYGSLACDLKVSSNHWGSTYQLSAWFKETAGWDRNTATGLQIDWQNSAGELIGKGEADVTGTSAWQWSEHTLESVVPEGAAKAHVVLKYSDAAETGAMLVDDVEVRVKADRLQTFDTWSQRQDKFGKYEPDWSVDNGKTVDNAGDLDLGAGGVFFAKYVEGSNNNKALEIFNASTQNVNLADYTLVFYTNGATTYAARDSIRLVGTLRTNESFVISQQKGYFPEGMDPADEIVAASNMQTNTLTFNGDDVVVLMKGNQVVDRIGQVGNNGWTSFNAFVMRDHTLTRRSWQAFGTTNAVTADWPLWDEWTVEGTDEFGGLGEFSRTLPDDVYSPSGLSLVLNTTNCLVTPELGDGVGDVTFWYRAATATNKTAGTIWVETSEDGETWTVRGSVTVEAGNTTWQSFSVYLNEPGARYLRLRSEAQASGLVRIDDVRVEASVTESRMQYWEEWTEPSWQRYPGTYNLAGWSLNGQIATNASGLCAQLGSGGSIVSPLYPEGGAGTVVMVISGSTSVGEAVQVYVSTNREDWTEVGSPLKVGNTRTNITVGVPGAAAVRLEAVCDETESFTVDNIEVRIFEGSAASRTQPFETWKVSSSYTKRTGEGWECNNGIVENREESKVLRLGKATGDYLMSPALEGIGVFSFDVAAYSSSHTPKFDVQISEDGKTWKTLKSYTIDSSATTLTSYSLSVQHEGTAYMRVAMTVAKLAVFDNFNVGSYKKPGSVSMVAGITPDPPSLEYNFRFTGDVMPVGQSTIEEVTMLYQTRMPPGQMAFGATNRAALAYDTEIGLYASGALPPMAVNTIMRYWLQVKWSTMEGASSVTNISYSATNETAFSEVTGGRVWINEIAYRKTPDDKGSDDDFWDLPEQKHEFIELCGPAGTDIGGWRVALMLTRTSEVEKAGKQTYATYTIPAGTKLPADVTVTNEDGKTMSYGFYVLGDKGAEENPLPNVDQAFASAYVPTAINADAASENDHIHHQGMVQLKTQYGAIVDTLVYGGYYQGQNAGAQDSSGRGSLSANGEGAEAASFEWGTANVTAGAINDDQTLVVRESIDPEVPQSLFHQAGRLVPGGLEDFHMIDSRSSGVTVWPADMRRDVQFYVGGPEEVIPVRSSGVLYVRHGTIGEFERKPMKFAEGAGDGTNNYLTLEQPFAAGELKRMETLQYFFEVSPADQQYLTGFVGSSVEGESEEDTSVVFGTADEAMEHPFTFVVPFPDFADDDFGITACGVEAGAQPGTKVYSVKLEASGANVPTADEMAVQVCTNLLPQQVWTTVESEGERTSPSEGRYEYLYTFELPEGNGMWAVRMKPSEQPDE